MRILVGSPIRQKHTILEQFLISLEEVDKTNLEVDYYFVDDNTDEKSSELLEAFFKRNSGILKKGADIYTLNQEYVCTETTHSWKRTLIEKITCFKNGIIEYAKDNNYDYLFFIDSDIVLHKNTIQHLLTRKVDIVSNVFWSQWTPGTTLCPQIWLQDSGACYKISWDKRTITAEEKAQQTRDFHTKMRIPGIYEVGGLGACTIISQKAIKAGVRFNIIDNVSFWGEDMHFCVTAAVLGFKLYVDTVYPSYHIYREEYLSRVDEFKRDGFKFDMCQTPAVKVENYGFKHKFKKFVKESLKPALVAMKKNKIAQKRQIGNKQIVASMIVKNEEGRFLPEVIERLKTFADKILIIDDASTDNTVKICEKLLEGSNYKIIRNKKSLFHKEYKLRMQQWAETVKMGCTWMYFVDADEVIEKNFATKVKYLMDDPNIDVYNFKLYDMWDENHYREDEFWKAHNGYSTFFVRYQPKYKYKFLKTNQHCGRVPNNLQWLNYSNVDIKVKHLGWIRPEDRERKYKRYMELDKDGKNGNLKQYQSILDKNPNLKEFNEND